MSHQPYIIDTTLRDGEQSPGVVFNLDDKLRIARLLDAIHIPEVEIGTPIIGRQEVADLQFITHAGFHFKSLVWCRATTADIDAAAQVGAQGINISFPVSDVHLLAMNKDKQWVFDTLRIMVDYAADKFEYIAIGAQDASRANQTFLSEFIEAAQEFGVARIRIADTVGILHPLATQKLFSTLKKSYPSMKFEFHGHNDLGMATANTVTALTSGADAASVTVNGLGERAGNAALEEVVMALELGCDIQTRLKTSYFTELSELVCNVSRITVGSQKPVVGMNAFQHESGIHTKLLLKNRETYQIIDATAVGKENGELVFGKHSGNAALKQFCRSHHIPLPDNLYPALNEEIKRQSALLKRGLSPHELLSFVQKTAADLQQNNYSGTA